MADRFRRFSRVPVRRPRPRTVVEAVAVVLVLLGLLWVADTGARAAAEALLTRNIRDAVATKADPEVRVGGGFFLPQVIRGAYDEVHVSAVGVTAGPLRIDRVDSTLTDVRVPFHDVVLSDVRTIGIGRADQTATLTYADLNAYFDATGRALRVGPAPDGRVQLSGAVQVLDQSVDVTAQTQVLPDSGRLILIPESVETSGTLGGATRLLLSQRLRLSVPMGTLPFGSQLTSVTAGSTGITLTATGNLVVLDP